MSKLHITDIDYLNPSRKDAAKAKAAKLRDYPSLEQIRAALAAMPEETPIERRNRALLAFAILPGMRDRAMASLSLRDLDLAKSPPLVRQEPNRVETKFAKAIATYFLPLGDDLAAIVTDWARKLREVHLFGPTDPLFPRTCIGQGADLAFTPHGIERAHWSDASPIRAIFRQAFTRAGLPYFPPHSFRHTLGHLAQTMCRTPATARLEPESRPREHRHHHPHELRQDRPAPAGRGYRRDGVSLCQR
nr:tyrosine-type recombinase/integrase [Ancylobacter lacus]